MIKSIKCVDLINNRFITDGDDIFFTPGPELEGSICVDVHITQSVFEDGYDLLKNLYLTMQPIPFMFIQGCTTVKQTGVCVGISEDYSPQKQHLMMVFKPIK